MAQSVAAIKVSSSSLKNCSRKMQRREKGASEWLSISGYNFLTLQSKEEGKSGAGG
jgi:hypothetical protein